MSVYEFLPPYYRIDEARQYGPAEAQDYTRRIARGHYENFTVVSWLLPRRLRQHLFNIYAYCRWADDLGDELPDANVCLRALEWWREELKACYRGTPKHPVFVALLDTIQEFDIPAEPFHHLLDAFTQDQTVRRYATYRDLLDYCERSANPVGRLVLHVCGVRDPRLQRLSDHTCTALQLTNFWQDVTVDWEKGRLYLPLEDLEQFGVSELQIEERRFDERFRSLMSFEVDVARRLFAEGLPLVREVPRRLRLDVELFTRGGLAILDLIEQQGYDVLRRRPELPKKRKMALMGRRLAAMLLP